MTASDPRAAAEWYLAKLVHDLDMKNHARMREHIAKLGITTSQAAALREMTGPMTMTELAGLMSCEPSNATIVVDKLESRQLIARRPHPTDRRAKQLILTPNGTKLRKRLLKVMSEEPLFVGLTKKEQGTLQELLQRAIGAAESART
jgi:MarR family transcriptional regulator, organic hydroperoxide resistance regulator